MKTILLIALLTVSAVAQRTEPSVCARESGDTTSVVLTICNYATGMTGLPQRRLYLRVYADGSGEYEENPPWKEGADDKNFTLVKHELKVSAGKLEEIIKLGGQPDFQNAKADYPMFQMWTDSGLETTIRFNGKEGEKKILVRNYSSYDKKNDERYPASLIAMLQLADELRNPKPAPKEPEIIAYNGVLEVGKTYRGEVNFGDAYGMRLTLFPKLPHGHSVMYAWPNRDKFPALDPDKDFGVRRIVFRVLSKEIENIDKNRWTTTFTIEIVRVE